MSAPKRSRARLLRAAGAICCLLAAAAAGALSPEDRATIDSARKEEATFGRLSLDTLAALERVEARSPSHPDVLALLRAGYTRRNDWTSLVALGERIPASRRTREDWRNLGAWLLADSRAPDAVALLEPLVRKSPADRGLSVLYGTALFETGAYAKAAPYLEQAPLDPRDPDSVAAATQRALVDFHRNDFAGAERRLRAVAAAAPDADGAANALGRVLVAQGKRDEGARWLAESATIRNRKGDERRRQLTLSALSAELSAAVAAGRYDAAEPIAARMLALADPPLKVRLYRYLAEVRTAAGRPDAARQASLQAAALEKAGP